MNPTQFEIWRPIPGFESSHEASNMGRVRTIDRVVRNRSIKGRVLRARADKDGYLGVRLCRNNKQIERRVHRLVLEAFVGPKPPNHECRHLDGDVTNNRLSNLKWGTSKENEADKDLHGPRYIPDNGTRARTNCPRGHLLEDPNLRASVKKIGQRGCLACHRASAYVRDHPSLKDRFQEVSDAYYRNIMTAY